MKFEVNICQILYYNKGITFQFQDGIQKVKMVSSDPVDLAYDPDSLGWQNPEGAKYIP